MTEQIPLGSEGNTDQPDNVEKRGDIEYYDKQGKVHFFDTPEDLAAFREEENSRDNK